MITILFLHNFNINSILMIILKIIATATAVKLVKVQKLL